MKSLILNGSPRRNGNTKDAVTAFSKDIEDIKIYDVAKLRLSGCTNCDGCRRNDNRCVIDDDTANVVEDIYTAENVVFASPVYCWGFTSQLKQIIDKIYSKDPVIHIKKRIGLILIGGGGLEDEQYETIASLFKQMCGYFGWELCFKRFYCAGDPGDMKQKDLEELSALGNEFCG